MTRPLASAKLPRMSKAKNSATVRLVRPASNLVDTFLETLEHPLRDDIVRVRQLIRETVPNVAEAIKWNAPSFALENTFFATFQLRSEDALQLVFHTGAAKRPKPVPITLSEDVQSLVKWLDADRALVTFDPGVAAQRKRFTTLLQEWVRQLPSE